MVHQYWTFWCVFHASNSFTSFKEFASFLDTFSNKTFNHFNTSFYNSTPSRLWSLTFLMNFQRIYKSSYTFARVKTLNQRFTDRKVKFKHLRNKFAYFESEMRVFADKRLLGNWIILISMNIMFCDYCKYMVKTCIGILEQLNLCFDNIDLNF